jgi:DNA-binding NtrC family response regulator
MPKVLIVDDQQHIRLPLAMMLTEGGYEVSQADSTTQALLMQRKLQPEIILLSESIQGINTIDTLRSLLDYDPKTRCIILTTYNVIPSSLETKRAGAFDYLLKPFDDDELLSVIKRALESRLLSVEEISPAALATSRLFNEIIGKSEPLLLVFRVMAKVAPLNVTLLIQGDSGTGKEMVVRAIHNRSTRKASPFVAINCAAVPASLFEAEFFGYEKGAFTDAKIMHAGYFERANRGTLFLDEVGDLSLESQVKLLRLIENQEVTRLGGTRPVKANVRIIAATNIDLMRAVERGDFRKDLFWRLNVVKIILPNLSERRGDIPLLITHMLKRFNRELGLMPKTIAPAAQEMLENYDWPGNVRELEHAISSAMIISEGDAVLVADLPPLVQGIEEALVKGEARLEIDLSAAGASLSEAVKNTVSEMERQMIIARLSALHSNRTATAESLGISRKSLFNKMRLYGLNVGPK